MRKGSSLSMIAMRVTFSRACARARKKKSDIICARKCAQMRARESEEDMRKKCVLDTDTKFVFVFFGTFSAKKFETHSCYKNDCHEYYALSGAFNDEVVLLFVTMSHNTS